MSKIIVLGTGLVGSVIAMDLAKDYDITAVDIKAEAHKNLHGQNIKFIEQDISNHDIIIKLVKDYDLVVGAVPGFMGYQLMKNIIEAGKNMVDISFMPEDPSDLHELAKKKGLCIVTDCGIAPGMSNIILGYHNKTMKVDSFKCLVGGLPVIREWPYEYKAVFSPIDVIEEYTRPARYVENGNIITRQALSDAELLEFEGIGTLESWNSDGLRSLIHTMKIPSMIEKTLRYPGSIEYLKVLRESGFFSYDEININGKMIRPIDLTASLLFPKWKLKPGEEDFTVMRITVYGDQEGNNKQYTYNLFDRYDKENSIPSMARTTGYTCSSAVNLLLQNKFSRAGVNHPEFLGEDHGNFNFIINYLSERNVIFNVKES